MLSVSNIACRRVRAAIALALGLSVTSIASATVYSGNGASGFGGAVGNGSLTVTEDSSSNITFTLSGSTPIGSSGGTNNFVLYLDSVAGGFADNSTFTDNGDGGREAVSAANNSNPSRVNISFPTGFGADYALSFEYGFVGLFKLNSASAFTYIDGAAQSTNNPYTLTIPASEIGLSAGQGFSFDGDLISQTAYGSNETVGPSTSSDGTTAGNSAGFNGSITYTSADTFGAVGAPEPTSLGLLGVAVFSGAGLRRNRRNVAV